MSSRAGIQSRLQPWIYGPKSAQRSTILGFFRGLVLCTSSGLTTTTLVGATLVGWSSDEANLATDAFASTGIPAPMLHAAMAAVNNKILSTTSSRMFVFFKVCCAADTKVHRCDNCRRDQDGTRGPKNKPRPLSPPGLSGSFEVIVFCNLCSLQLVAPAPEWFTANLELPG